MATFAEFAVTMRNLAFPQRINPQEWPLKKWHTATGLGELQRRVRCLRESNLQEVLGNTPAITFQGTSTAPRPDGQIREVWIGSVLTSSCDFQAGYVSNGTMRSLQQEFARSRGGGASGCAGYVAAFPPADLWYTIDEQTNLLVFYPGLPTGWMANIRYSAIRSTWADSDIVPELNTAETDALRCWLLYRDASDKGCYQNLKTLWDIYEEAARNACYECNRTTIPDQLLRMPVTRLTSPLCSSAYTGCCYTSSSGSETATTLTGVAGADAARALTGLSANQIVYLLYLETEGDQQGGEFYFVSGSATDDGVDILVLDDGTGYLLRLQNQN